MGFSKFLFRFVLGVAFVGFSGAVFAQIDSAGSVPAQQVPESETLATGNLPPDVEPSVGGGAGIGNVAAVVAHHLFYNDSAFDLLSDADAIAPDVIALAEGETATFQNYSSFLHGINGVMIDVDDLPNGITLADFELKIGNDNYPDQWLDAPTPTLSFEDGGGTAGADRVKLIFPNGSITKCWLKVRMISNANTELTEDDVFYFGNAIGETGNSVADALVNLADVAGTRQNQTGFGSADIDNNFDHNRDGRVRLDDVAIARTNQSGFSEVQLITPRSNLAIPAGLGRGVNFGNMLEAPSEGAWGFTVEEIFFDKVVEGGFDYIRLPVSWTYHTDTVAPYTIDEIFFQRVDWCVAKAKERNLKIIVNVHHYDELNADPVAESPRALAMWDQIATRYQNESDAVLFEVLNEPHGAFNDTPSLWTDYMLAALDEIRATNPNRKVLVGPVRWNAVSSLDGFVIPPDPHLIVTVHNYEPFAFTHQGASWVDPVPPLGTEWHNDRVGFAGGWQSWSWGSTIVPTVDGLSVRYDQAWAGCRFHNNDAITNADTLELTIDGAMTLKVVWQNPAGDSFEQNLQTGVGVNDYEIDLNGQGTLSSISDVVLQEISGAPAGPYHIKRLQLRGPGLLMNLVESEEDAVRGLMKNAAKWSLQNNVPLHLGEFGAYNPADMDSRVRWTTALRSVCEELRIDWSYWELVAGFGVWDPENETWRTPLIQSLNPDFGN